MHAPSTCTARNGASLPFSSSGGSGSSSATSAIASAVTSPATTRPGSAAAWQPRRDVDGVAGHRPAVGGRFADDRLAGVDADAQPERLGLEVERRVQPLDRRNESEPGAHRALGVVVAGARNAEHRHHRVADVFVEGTALRE